MGDEYLVTLPVPLQEWHFPVPLQSVLLFEGDRWSGLTSENGAAERYVALTWTINTREQQAGHGLLSGMLTDTTCCTIRSSAFFVHSVRTTCFSLTTPPSPLHTLQTPVPPQSLHVTS